VGDPVSTQLLPGLDWLVKFGFGLIVAAAGLLLIRPPRRGGLRFALGVFTIEAGTLVAIRGIVAAGSSHWWQYLMPFALVLVPALFIAAVLTRLHWWRRVGFTPLREWRAPHLIIPLLLILVLPIVGLSARGVLQTTVLVLGLQIGFLLIDIFMEEVTYRGVILEALGAFSLGSRVMISASLFGLSHLDNLFLPGADPIGVGYQVFEAVLVGVLFGAVRLRMNTIWLVMAVHATYDLILVLAFGHAFPVAPTLPGFIVATLVNLALAVIGLLLLRRQPSADLGFTEGGLTCGCDADTGSRRQLASAWRSRSSTYSGRARFTTSWRNLTSTSITWRRESDEPTAGRRCTIRRSSWPRSRRRSASRSHISTRRSWPGWSRPLAFCHMRLPVGSGLACWRPPSASSGS
jgi:membrane protease YdiL (CAAX protease family)